METLPHKLTDLKAPPGPSPSEPEGIDHLYIFLTIPRVLISFDLPEQLEKITEPTFIPKRTKTHENPWSSQHHLPNSHHWTNLHSMPDLGIPLHLLLFPYRHPHAHAGCVYACSWRVRFPAHLDIPMLLFQPVC